MVRRVPSKHQNSPIARELDRDALLRLALLLVCGLVIAGGFLYAGRQHFAALKYGYETENLRKIRDELAQERRRFLLEREEAMSPARVERAARQLGLQPMQSSQIDPLERPTTAEDKPAAVPQKVRSKSRDRIGLARPAKADSNKPI